tara:strand:- start:975 stop:1196 length:222 start_codon:yes stop_codon:yes gene_type:complete
MAIITVRQLGINSNVTLGGEVSDTDNAYKNYSTVSANATLNLASGNNYFLAGIITINNNVTWTISGSGTLTII